MTPSVTYTATSWREGATWLVRVVQLDRITRATRLSEVESAARRLICAVTGEPSDQVRVVVDVRVPEGISRVLESAAAARQEADLVSVPAVALRRTLARRLTDHGYGVREIAVVLGVSYARAQQLVGAVGSTTGGKPHTSYQHEAFLYRDRGEFLAGTAPFVQDGVRLGQPVLVALVRPLLDLLRSAIGVLDGDGPSRPGGSGGPVTFVDMAVLGGNPARIMPAWLDFVAERVGRGRPMRGVGEPLWPGRRPEENVECQLHEGLLNVAIAPDVPLWLRCPYDVSQLPDVLIEGALQTHPAVVEGGDYRGSTSYGGLHHVNSVFRSELPPAPADSARIAFTGPDLDELRSHLSRVGRRSGLDPDRCRDLTHAVAEIAGNAVRHGGGKGELLTWVQPGALVCEVIDPGRLGDPMAGRRAPSPGAESDRGLWLANQISDLVQVRSTATGTAARVFAWL